MNYLAAVLHRDPRGNHSQSIASAEVEETFSACIASGHLTEATFLGEELLSSVFGNRNVEHLDRAFATIVALQAAKVAQIAKLLQLQLMDPQMTESVAIEEVRRLKESWRDAGALPRFQAVNKWARS